MQFRHAAGGTNIAPYPQLSENKADAVEPALYVIQCSKHTV